MPRDPITWYALLSTISDSKYSSMISCLRTSVHKQPIIALYFESENELEFITSTPGTNSTVLETTKLLLVWKSDLGSQKVRNNINDPQKKHRLGTVSINIVHTIPRIGIIRALNESTG